jgi:hypothetical protein
MSLSLSRLKRSGPESHTTTQNDPGELVHCGLGEQTGFLTLLFKTTSGSAESLLKYGGGLDTNSFLEALTQTC